MSPFQRVAMTVTGMRSHKLFGKDYNEPQYIRIINQMMEYLHKHPEIVSVNSGLATGIDLLMGLAVIKYNNTIHDRMLLNCYIPGTNQTKYYGPKEVDIYNFILKHANNIINVSDGPANAKALMNRNRAMVNPDICNFVLSFWDQKDYRSGTYVTMKTARDNNITVYNIDPKDPADRGYFFISSTDEPKCIVKEDPLVMLTRGYVDELRD